MKRKDLFTLKRGIESCGELTGSRFCYSLAKAKLVLDNELKAIEESRPKYSDEFNEYVQKENELAQKYALKGKDGDVIRDNKGNFTITDSKSFTDDLKKLQEKYDKTIKANKKLTNEFNEFLNEEIDIKLPKIREKDLPENISVQQLNDIVLLLL